MKGVVRRGTEKGGCTIYADAVAQVGVCEDLGAVGDCQRGSSSTGCGIILLYEAGDGWLG